MTNSASGPSSLEFITGTRIPVCSRTKETQVPVSGMVMVISLANSTLGNRKVARLLPMSHTPPLPGGSYSASSSNFLMPSSSMKPGQLENNVIDLLLSIPTLLLLPQLVLLSLRCKVSACCALRNEHMTAPTIASASAFLYDAPTLYTLASPSPPSRLDSSCPDTEPPHRPVSGRSAPSNTRT